MLEKLSKMSVRSAIITVAGSHPEWGGQKRWLMNAAKKVQGVSFRTMRSLWLNEISDPNHWAAREVKRQAEIIKARREAADLATQFESIAGAMNATDPDFYSADATALLQAARIVRGLDRT